MIPIAFSLSDIHATENSNVHHTHCLERFRSNQQSNKATEIREQGKLNKENRNSQSPPQSSC